MQTPGLIEIDLSFNEIRSVESRALDLKYLSRVQLAYNDWSCDCFIKPLKTFLRSKIEYDQLLFKSGFDRLNAEYIGIKCGKVFFSPLKSSLKMAQKMKKPTLGYGNLQRCAVYG